MLSVVQARGAAGTDGARPERDIERTLHAGCEISEVGPSLAGGVARDVRHVQTITKV
jgi:hypothetical protein